MRISDWSLDVCSSDLGASGSVDGGGYRMLMEIPFTHETGGVFTESVGMPGLDHSSFGALMPRAAKSIELLRGRKASGELPLLSLPARRDDIHAWQPIVDRYRSQFDDVVVLGIGGSSLGGATLCRLAASGIGAVNGSPRVRFLDNLDPWAFQAHRQRAV